MQAGRDTASVGDRPEETRTSEVVGLESTAEEGELFMCEAEIEVVNLDATKEEEWYEVEVDIEDTIPRGTLHEAAASEPANEEILADINLEGGAAADINLEGHITPHLYRRDSD